MRLQRVSSWSSPNSSNSAAKAGFSAFLLDSAEVPLRNVACTHDMWMKVVKEMIAGTHNEAAMCMTCGRGCYLFLD